jgi:hypothetical protein
MVFSVHGYFMEVDALSCDPGTTFTDQNLNGQTAAGDADELYAGKAWFFKGDLDVVHTLEGPMQVKATVEYVVDFVPNTIPAGGTGRRLLAEAEKPAAAATPAPAAAKQPETKSTPNTPQQPQQAAAAQPAAAKPAEQPKQAAAAEPKPAPAKPATEQPKAAATEQPKPAAATQPAPAKPATEQPKAAATEQPKPAAATQPAPAKPATEQPKAAAEQPKATPEQAATTEPAPAKPATPEQPKAAAEQPKPADKPLPAAEPLPAQETLQLPLQAPVKQAASSRSTVQQPNSLLGMRGVQPRGPLNGVTLAPKVDPRDAGGLPIVREGNLQIIMYSSIPQ